MNRIPPGFWGPLAWLCTHGSGLRWASVTDIGLRNQKLRFQGRRSLFPVLRASADSCPYPPHVRAPTFSYKYSSRSWMCEAQVSFL